ncbi:DUF485 domain-containing protein [Streptomyces sp. RS10V-4]|uniref:DUF485 domain-containing protein n=1 Tax=Streptomyces rhizoryzae TaxID=2932493 RepID=UPI002006444B|nr:DUF485 domain-containing protein [Streptomyces rhizoryzae]MCK7621822.1 DUF485 domain-containing protein [Streptomyces rhizoryzae]
MNTHASPPGSPTAGAPDSTGAPPAAGDLTATVFRTAQQGRPFRELRRSHRTFAAVATTAVLSLYLLYVLLSSYAPGLMTGRVVGNLNVALFLGLAQFAATFLAAWLYTRHAHRRRDPLAEEIRDGIEQARIRAHSHSEAEGTAA